MFSNQCTRCPKKSKCPPLSKMSHFFWDTLCQLISSKKLGQFFFYLCSRESDPDMEVWSISSAAVQCLSQLCEFFSTPVDNKIGSFIQVYINSSDINLKFTSIICVSTLLSMQDQQSKVSVVSSFLQISQDLLSDSCFNIKYAASFVLYKISEISLSIILQDQQMIQTFENLCLSCINSEQPKVVGNGCYSIGNFYREISNFNGEIFMKIFNRLLFLSEAQTSQQIQQAVSSSIIDIVEHFPLEYYKLLGTYQGNARGYLGYIL